MYLFDFGLVNALHSILTGMAFAGSFLIFGPSKNWSGDSGQSSLANGISFSSTKESKISLSVLPRLSCSGESSSLDKPYVARWGTIAKTTLPRYFLGSFSQAKLGNGPYTLCKEHYEPAATSVWEEINVNVIPDQASRAAYTKYRTLVMEWDTTVSFIKRPGPFSNEILHFRAKKLPMRAAFQKIMFDT
eukprot:6465488-Amphidinium_carterae.4